MTGFRVEWTQQALDDLSALDATVQLRVVLRTKQARENPLRFFSRLKGDRAYKLRVGDWRLVADISLAKREIVVVAVSHRKNAYR